MNVDAKNAEDVAKVWRRLSDPFHPDAVKWKPSMVKNNRALAMAYIDARLVMDRLDKVVNPNNWQACYTLLPDGSVECRLSVRVDGGWITKADVGSQSEQPDGGDRMKAAYSDALKRAAVHWGIGRYLYRLPSQWVDYDPVKKQFVSKPRLPAFAIPKEADEDEADAPEVPEPKPVQPALPKPPAVALKAKYVTRFAAAKDMGEFDRICADLESEKTAGQLTGADLDGLRQDAKACRDRLKGAQPAGAKS